MTDLQIKQFLVNRARINGQAFGLFNPRLVLCKPNNGVYLAIIYENHNQPFLVRFIRNDSRGVFKLDISDPDYQIWKNNNNKKPIIEYDLNVLPDCIKHYVSYAIIEALKTKKMGFDCFSISFYDGDPLLIDQDETYEEASIEADLFAFEIEKMN